MLVTIHQPNYLPWSGFFHKWMLADAFVILDTVQYHKNEWQNRNRIKTANGPQWITVPVGYRFPQRIDEVTISGDAWVRKQARAIEQAYAKAPYLDDYWPELRAILSRDWQHIARLNSRLIRAVGEMLGCTAPLHIASEMATCEEDPTERLIQLTRELGGDAYLSGREGRNYLQQEAFSAAGLELWFQEAEAPVYPQLHGEFVSHLSVIDLLFNVGPDAAEVIRKMGEIAR
jgi:hypothetical protein